MMIRRRYKKSLRKDEGGATVIEFALAAPIFFVLLIGIFDFAYAIYSKSILVGAVNEAGRASALESGQKQLSQIDQRVTELVQDVMPSATLTFSRKNYQSFSQMGRPEDFIDANGNQKYDNGECFMDLNKNEQWDSDSGSKGQGGADDVVIYSVEMVYDDIFPLWNMIGIDSKRKAYASTLLKNQPFAEQAQRNAETVCP